jgi:hypothetical protein
MSIPPSIIFEFICLLASLTLFFQKDTPTHLKLFCLFLFVTLCVEVTGVILWLKGKSNILLYNMFGVFSVMFYLFFIRNIIHNIVVKRLISLTIVIYPLLTFLNIQFVQVNAFHSITYSLGCLLIVAACAFYFYELFQLKQSINLLREPSFWICSALLFFFSCTLPFIGMTNFLFKVSPGIAQNLGSILAIINFLLYSLFTIAFLCRLRIAK